eukprot:2981202-Rhodomonas_salina.1
MISGDPLTAVSINQAIFLNFVALGSQVPWLTAVCTEQEDGGSTLNSEVKRAGPRDNRDRDDESCRGGGPEPARSGDE